MSALQRAERDCAGALPADVQQLLSFAYTVRSHLLDGVYKDASISRCLVTQDLATLYCHVMSVNIASFSYSDSEAGLHKLCKRIIAHVSSSCYDEGGASWN